MTTENNFKKPGEPIEKTEIVKPSELPIDLRKLAIEHDRLNKTPLWRIILEELEIIDVKL